MAKLTINAAPTFFAEVAIPVPGKGDVKVKFEFKHRTRDELDAWLKARADTTLSVAAADVQSVMDMVKSWDFDDPFSEASVATLLQSYIGTARATIDTYIDQLLKGRSGN